LLGYFYDAFRKGTVDCEEFPCLKFLLKWVNKKVANQKDSRYGSEVV